MSTTIINDDFTPFPGASANAIARSAGGAVKTGGTVHTGLARIPLPLQVDIYIDPAVEGLISGSGSYTTPADGTTFDLNDPTQLRKKVELNNANEINDTLGDLNRGLDYREVTTSGLEQLRDGRYVDSLGSIYAHPSGHTLVSPEIIDGLGDTAAKTRDEASQSYFYKMGGTQVEKTLPSRN